MLKYLQLMKIVVYLFYRNLKTKQKMKTFEKQEANEKFNHAEGVIKMFAELGFTNVDVKTCTTNGLTHYVSIKVDVLNENKLWADMYTWNGMAFPTVRISDHSSNIDKFGCVGDVMNLNHFKMLIKNGAIKSNN